MAATPADFLRSMEQSAAEAAAAVKKDESTLIASWPLRASLQQVRNVVAGCILVLSGANPASDPEVMVVVPADGVEDDLSITTFPMLTAPLTRDVANAHAESVTARHTTTRTWIE